MTTPIEQYNGIFVKREDLSFPEPAPPFSKCRGIVKHLTKLKQEGYTTVGYTETSISMAGWGLAWACKNLGMKCVIFDPQYVKTPEVLEFHREQWKKFDAEIIPIKAGMAKVNWYISKELLKKYPNSILLPLGLPFHESIEATAKEAISSLLNPPNYKTIVVCVGSGTICAGIVRALYETGKNIKLIGIMTRSGNVEEKKKLIIQKAGLINSGFFQHSVDLLLVNPNWEYTQKSEITVPFPCHAYYDAKAWQWLMENKKMLKNPILFWNIGH